MSLHPARTSKGFRAKTAFMAGVAGVALVAAATLAPANAAGVTVGARGATAITLGGKAITTLEGGTCGALTATTIGGATAISTTRGLKLVLKVTGFAVNDNGVVTVFHAGAVTLENSCYTIALKAFRIVGYGTLNQSSVFDLNANVKVGNVGQGREVIGTLDLSNAVIGHSGSTVTVNQANLLASADGAALLNQLAVGDVAGPFAEGDKVGYAKSKVTFTGV